MQITTQCYWMPKSGNTDTDYEDAYAVGDTCVALADGATESSFARRWAQGLVEGFVRVPRLLTPLGTRKMQEWLRPLQEEWYAGVAWDRLPWYAEDKARQGAFASLLGFQVIAPDAEPAGSHDPAEGTFEWRWQAFAIGDTCLFHIREERLLKAFPLERSEQFDSRPLLLSSNPANNARVWEEVVVENGDFKEGDLFLFATDALAKWFLIQCEAGESPWKLLIGLETPQEFGNFIQSLRQEHRLRNDDVTLVIARQYDQKPSEPETQESGEGESKTMDPSQASNAPEMEEATE